MNPAKILDDINRVRKIDQNRMLTLLEEMPEMLLRGYELGRTIRPLAAKGIERIIIAGMGGSAISGDIAAALLAGQSIMSFPGPWKAAA